VQHGHLLQQTPAKTSAATQVKRQAVLNRDPHTIAEALAYLAQPRIPRHAWYIFEGTTRPDVYLETPDVLIVIEGKRTEREPTSHTEWMPRRHQLLRHLDCAWEVRGQRTVLGFFIVEGQGAPMRSLCR
jgi:hypothetical protein